MILAQKTFPNPQNKECFARRNRHFPKDSNDFGSEDVPKTPKNRRASRAETLIS